MARSEDVTIHVPADVIAQIRQDISGDERRELESRRYSLNRTFEAQAILELALREYARQQGYTVTEDTEVVPLESGGIEVQESEKSSVNLNPFAK
jgi:hypothetical protein